MNHQSTRGFTLIEMIVVIALIGILMGVAFPQTTKFLAAGRDTKRISDVSRVVPGYLELYFNQKGEYPSGNWDSLEEALGSGPQGANVLGNKKLPVATSNSMYCYAPTNDNFGYILGVQLEQPNKVLDDSIQNQLCEDLMCGVGNVYCVEP
jgi:general secretion pathway protein G